MFMLVARRYERASLIVTSNKPFSASGEIFGDEVTATAMIDRLVHHAAQQPEHHLLLRRALQRTSRPPSGRPFGAPERDLDTSSIPD